MGKELRKLSVCGLYGKFIKSSKNFASSAGESDAGFDSQKMSGRSVFDLKSIRYAHNVFTNDSEAKGHFLIHCPLCSSVRGIDRTNISFSVLIFVIIDQEPAQSKNPPIP